MQIYLFRVRRAMSFRVCGFKSMAWPSNVIVATPEERPNNTSIGAVTTWSMVSPAEYKSDSIILPLPSLISTQQSLSIPLSVELHQVQAQEHQQPLGVLVL